MKFYTFAAMRKILNAQISASAKASSEATSAASAASDVSSLSELSTFPPFPLLTRREELVKRILYIVSLIEPPVDETPSLLVLGFPVSERQGVFPASSESLASQEKNFTQLVTLVLSQPLSAKLLQYVLLRLPTHYLPYLHQPLFLTDFLTDCYNYGGVLAVMALGGLFYLITGYSVSYPEYYPKLYELLTDDVFVLKWGRFASLTRRYRQKFLTLLVKSLRSSEVPALVVAAFCKKLCRIAVRSAPATALFVIPLVTELLTYHPSLYPLLQVEDREDVYDVVSVRKPLPGVEEAEEAEAMRRKQRGADWIDDEDDDEDDDEEEEESVIESESESESDRKGKNKGKGASETGEDEKGGKANAMEEEKKKKKDKEAQDEVVAEVDDRTPVRARSTTVPSSEIVRATLQRMERKRQQLASRPELPAKLPHVEYSFRSGSAGRR